MDELVKKLGKITSFTLIIILIASLTVNFPYDATAQEFRFKFGSQGSGDGQFSFPVGIAVDGPGNIYVADTNNHRVQKFDSAVAFQLKFGANGGDGTSGSGDGQFINPSSIAVDSSGNIYVADSSNRRVQIFNSVGVFQSMFGWGVKTGAAAFEICTSSCQGGSFGSGDGQFRSPDGIAVDIPGNIYVTDMNNHRVQKFNSAVAFQLKFGANGGDGSFGSGDGQFNSPEGIAVDSSGNIYVADTGNKRVQIFDSAGVFQLMFGWGVDTGAEAFETCTSSCQGGEPGTGDGQFDDPVGITVDDSGNIYVADTNNDRVQIFDSAGAFQSKFGSSGTGDGQFNVPRHITLDSTSNIYVVDGDNHRIQKFVNAPCQVPTMPVDMIIDEDCILSGIAIAPANVIVQSGAIMFISNGATLDIDFVNNFLRIESGSGVLIRSGGTIT